MKDDDEIDPDLIPDRTIIATEAEFEPSPIAKSVFETIRMPKKNREQKHFGPWMSDEVPHDGMQKWLALCWTTNKDGLYTERIMRREEQEAYHDAWAR